MIKLIAFLPFIFQILIFTGCSTHPDEYNGLYVSPNKYKTYTCKQIAEEVQRLNKKIGITYENALGERHQDLALTTVGVVFFWPALFFMDGDEMALERYGYIKGELEAFETSAKLKKCIIKYKK